MTPLWTPKDMLAATGGTGQPGAATGVSIDTRTLQAGDLFVALAGERGDGHDHVAAALSRGASGVMVHRDMTGPVLRVADTLAGLGALATSARRRFAGKLLAVTGSVGKTTTKEMLRRILAARGVTHAAHASYNNHWGVPLTLARMPPSADFSVVEIGTNHPGEIAPLSVLARPHVALVTAVERAHVGNFDGIEAIADEKGAIASGLEHDGTLILPADSPHLPRLQARAGAARMLTFGRNHGADARMVALDSDAEGSDIEFALHGEIVRLRLGVPGAHMAMNAVAAVLSAAALGGLTGAGLDALQDFRPVAGRGVRRRIAVPDGAVTLLDESYNASRAAVAAALSVLRLQGGGRRIAVLGDMLELGAEGPAEHDALTPQVAASADLLFACGPLMKRVFDAIPAENRGGYAESSHELAPLVAAAVKDGDAILVKGSLGTRMQPIVDALARLAETH